MQESAKGCNNIMEKKIYNLVYSILTDFRYDYPDPEKDKKTAKIYTKKIIKIVESHKLPNNYVRVDWYD